jgi:uncharacterized membrane protein
MFFKKRRRANSLRFKKEILPQILLVLGFICAALIEETINLLHENVITWGPEVYLLYCVLIFLCLCLVVSLIFNVIKNVYMEFGLSSSNPVGDIVPRGVVGVTMMAFDISAPNEDEVTIKRLTVSHAGGSVQDIDRVYLTIDGARVSPVASFDAKGTAALHFLKPVSIEPGKKITVDVNADFTPGASAGSQHRLLIESEESLVTNAHTTMGSFPVAGAWFRVGAVTCGLIDIEYTEASGSGVMGGLLFSADAVEDQTLYSLTLKKGLGSSGMVRNIYLSGPDGKRITNTVAHTVLDRVTLVFDPPFTLLKGTNANFELHGKSDSGEEAKLYIEQSSDVFGVGSLYGYGLQGQLYGSSVRIK